MRKNGFFRNFVGVMVTAVTISQCQSGQLVGAAEIQPETVAVESFEMAEDMGQNAGVNWATPWDADEVEENAGRDEVRDTDQKIATPGDAEIDSDIVDGKDGKGDLERTPLSLAAGDLWEDWNGEMHEGSALPNQHSVPADGALPGGGGGNQLCGGIPGAGSGFGFGKY